MIEDYSRKSLLRSEILPFLITITSLTVAGKSSLMEVLKIKFRLRNIKMDFISAGGIMRNLAKDLGFSSIDDFARHNAENPGNGYDWLVDEQVRRIGENDHQIIEGRLPHIFVPKGFHIFLRCPLEVRVWRRYEWQNPEGLSFEGVMRQVIERDESDQIRYESLYPGCIWKEYDYDLIIDSSSMTVDEEVRAIIRGWRRWLVRNSGLIRRP